MPLRLASRLYEGLLSFECENEKVSVIPTRDEKGNYAVLLSYSSEFFNEDIDTLCEKLSFEEKISGRPISIYRIDKDTTNPYRLYERLCKGDLTAEDIVVLRKEGELSPVYTGIIKDDVEFVFTPNSTYFITIH